MEKFQKFAVQAAARTIEEVPMNKERWHDVGEVAELSKKPLANHDDL